jgi:hypothetical protein
MYNELKSPVAKKLIRKKYLSPYQRWQQETYANILPEFHSLNIPQSNTWAERQAELELINHEII